MESIGEDSPSYEDIQYFGLFYSCQKTNGNFALYEKNGNFAARGRVGTSPLFWDRLKRSFSFVPDEFLEEFPPGYLYDGKRLVCWDPLYYDKPMHTDYDEADFVIQKTLSTIVSELQHKVDAVIFSSNDGSLMMSKYIMRENLPAFTVVVTPKEKEPYTNKETNHTIVYSDGIAPMYDLAKYLKENTPYRKFMCGYGLDNLVKGDFHTFSNENMMFEDFSLFGLEMYSPFCDFRLVNYVLDCTDPNDRKKLLSQVISIDDEEDD